MDESAACIAESSCTKSLTGRDLCGCNTGGADRSIQHRVLKGGSSPIGCPARFARLSTYRRSWLPPFSASSPQPAPVRPVSGPGCWPGLPQQQACCEAAAVTTIGPSTRAGAVAAMATGVIETPAHCQPASPLPPPYTPAEEIPQEGAAGGQAGSAPSAGEQPTQAPAAACCCNLSGFQHAWRSAWTGMERREKTAYTSSCIWLVWRCCRLAVQPRTGAPAACHHSGHRGRGHRGPAPLRPR